MTTSSPEAPTVRRRRILPAVGCLLLLLALAAGLVALDRIGRSTTGDAYADDATTSQAPAPTPAAGVPVPRAIADPDQPPDPVVPVELRIPDLEVTAPVVPIGTDGDVLVPPAAPRVLGWWQDGVATGAPVGAALIAGHTVHSGGGALDDLETLEPGALVEVQGSGRELLYRVANVRVLSKGRLAQQAEELFDQTGAPRLVLLTCEGWNGDGYDSNVVVTAFQVSSRA